jgi:hypothetical protein
MATGPIHKPKTMGAAAILTTNGILRFPAQRDIGVSPLLAPRRPSQVIKGARPAKYTLVLKASGRMQLLRRATKPKPAQLTGG